MRLADGTLWPLPVTLPVTPGDGIAEGKPLALRDVYGNLLAFLHVEEIYAYDKEAEARNAYGSTDAKHPSVAHLDRQPGHYAVGPARGDPRAAALRLRRDPPHPGRAPRSLPVAGLEQDRRLPDPQPPAPGARGADQARRRADRRRPPDPPGRRRHQAGRRGPLHAGAVLSRPGRQLLRAGDRGAQPAAPGHAHGRSARGAAARDHPPQLRLHPLHRRPRPRRARQRLAPASRSTRPMPPRSRWASTRTRSAWRWSTSSRWSTCPTRTAIARSTQVPPGARTADISGTQVRDKYLAKGLQLPEWFSRPAVAEILDETNPPKFRQGLTIWFTGLSGSGKSTVAHAPDRTHGRVRPQLLAPGRRRDPHPPLQGPGLQQGRPRHQHPPRRLRRQPGHPARRHHALLGDQPVSRHPRRGPQAVQGELPRGLLQHPGRGLRAARRQGDVLQGPRGRRRGQADGLHRRGRSLRAAD